MNNSKSNMMFIKDQHVGFSIQNQLDPMLILKAKNNQLSLNNSSRGHNKCLSNCTDIQNQINFSKAQNQRKKIKNISNLLPPSKYFFSNNKAQSILQSKENKFYLKMKNCSQQASNEQQKKHTRNFCKFAQKIDKQPLKIEKTEQLKLEEINSYVNKKRSSLNENINNCLYSQNQANESSVNKDNVQESLLKQSNFTSQKTQLESFQIGELLGKGAFGTVHIVRHKKTGYFFALKTYLKKNILPKLDRFIHCLKLQILAAHPNIAQLYTVFADQQKFYEIMQLCIDGDLSNQSKKLKKSSEQIRRRIFKGIIKGIQFLHQNHTIHRDIKLENILLNYGMPKITDFDLAIYIPNPTQSRRTFCGSPMYYSPEMLTNQCYNSKVDIWSLGIVCYEIVCGYFPFELDKYDQIHNIVNQQIKSFPENVDENVKKLIESMLRKDPEERACWQDIISHPYFQNCKNP